MLGRVDVCLMGICYMRVVFECLFRVLSEELVCIVVTPCVEETDKRFDDVWIIVRKVDFFGG